MRLTQYFRIRWSLVTAVLPRCQPAENMKISKAALVTERKGTVCGTNDWFYSDIVLRLHAFRSRLHLTGMYSFGSPNFYKYRLPKMRTHRAGRRKQNPIRIIDNSRSDNINAVSTQTIPSLTLLLLGGKPHNLILEHLLTHNMLHCRAYWNKEVTLRFPKHLIALLEAPRPTLPRQLSL